MLGFPLGILSAAGAGGAVVAGPAYELISSTILGGTAASVTFSSLGDYSSTYKHLQVRMVGRTNRSGFTQAGVRIQFNGIGTGNQYAVHTLEGQGGSIGSFASTSINSTGGGYFTAASSTANAFGAQVVDILDVYSASKNTTIRGLSGDPLLVSLFSGALFNTAAITSIVIFPTTDSFIAGSRFSLYGIKG
jgi:hypothetical protein